ncbi:type II toxin-antitoxin system VapC family toxin [Hyperthermus butylicus]|uniref:Ribonuclease VapC n=1 Tax=Hyperthermus butylicus (strain DSM 5456 / JCM 9403 / PLM1-5) TaxID=415426 RepID=A2BJP2_HYPBU|nr:PIN domain-containing protein [Hyperthermus butylicus]ABM80203.1 hypothetical protein Hbut_0331 [Hyperthermus butylicus DSM 5456]
MALVLDTRFLIAYTFPPSSSDRDALRVFLRRLLREKAVIPSIVLAEYLRVAGRRLGIDAALLRATQFQDLFTVHPIGAREAVEAGKLLARYNVPVADALIAAVAKALHARIVSNDKHFELMGLETLWYK